MLQRCSDEADVARMHNYSYASYFRWDYLSLCSFQQINRLHCGWNWQNLYTSYSLITIDSIIGWLVSSLPRLSTTQCVSFIASNSGNIPLLTTCIFVFFFVIVTLKSFIYNLIHDLAFSFIISFIPSRNTPNWLIDSWSSSRAWSSCVVVVDLWSMICNVLVLDLNRDIRISNLN